MLEACEADTRRQRNPTGHNQTAASERHGPQLEGRRYRSRRHWSAEKCAPRRRCSEGIARIPLSVSRRIGNRTRVRLWRSNARHSDLKSALRLERANRVRKKQSSAIIAAEV